MRMLDKYFSNLIIVKIQLSYNICNIEKILKTYSNKFLDNKSGTTSWGLFKTELKVIHYGVIMTTL